MSVLRSYLRLFRWGSALVVFVGLLFNNGLFWDVTSRRPTPVASQYRGQGNTAAHELIRPTRSVDDVIGLTGEDDSTEHREEGADGRDRRPL